MIIKSLVVGDLLMAQFGAVAMGLLVGCYFEGKNREDLSENEDDREMHVCDGGLVRCSVDGCMEGCLVVWMVDGWLIDG